MKRIIRLNESDIHRMVNNSVRRIINEMSYKEEFKAQLPHMTDAELLEYVRGINSAVYDDCEDSKESYMYTGVGNPEDFDMTYKDMLDLANEELRERGYNVDGSSCKFSDEDRNAKAKDDLNKRSNRRSRDRDDDWIRQKEEWKKAHQHKKSYSFNLYNDKKDWRVNRKHNFR